MLDKVYQWIAQLGYVHPLHPAVTHIPLGCIIAGFFFLIIARMARNPAFFQSARHCMGLALAFLPIVAILGYMDWQHFYAGAWLWPIKAKLVLASTLFILLLAVNSMRSPLNRPPLKLMLLYTLCLAVAVGLGYFGGELVYGAKPAGAVKPQAQEAALSPLAQAGERLFQQKCAFCHYTNKTDTKVGPGLKGISKRPTLPVSGLPPTDENLRKQLKTPYAKMPPFADLPQKQVDQIIAYLKSL